MLLELSRAQGSTGIYSGRAKALMMPVVPRNSASSSHSEDGEVSRTASSDRHSSRDRILIKRPAAERATAHTAKVSVQRGRQPPREQLC